MADTDQQPTEQEMQDFLARLTPEQRAQLAAVSGAGAEAIAANAPDRERARSKANEAMSQAAKDQKLEIGDDTISKMVDELIERLSGLGAFDSQPAAAASAAEQPAPEVAAEAAAEVATVQAPPRKLSWAERHFGDA